LRARLSGITAAALPDIVYEYRQHHDSMTLSGKKEARLRSFDECTDIAIRYWRCPGATPDIRHACRRWHAWLTGWASVLELAAGHLCSALKIARRGLSRDPVWLILFARQLPSYHRWRRACSPLRHEPAETFSRGADIQKRKP
jgi:hypothetical protein